MASLAPRPVPLDYAGEPAGSSQWRPLPVGIGDLDVYPLGAIEDIDPIATPASTTAEAVATKVNEILAALKG